MDRSASPARWWDLPAALVLIILLGSFAARLVATDWDDHLRLAFNLVLLGAASGLALGQSCFGPRVVGGFAAAYGVFAVVWQLGLTLPGGVSWNERLLSLGGRALFALDQLLRQQSVSDPILALAAFFVLCWAIGADAGYSLTRLAHPWRSAVPAGIAILLINAYDSPPADPDEGSHNAMLAIFILFTLLLVARLAYLRRRSAWRQWRVYQPPEVGGDISQAAAIAAATLVMLAWAAPAMGSVVPTAQQFYQRASQPWTAVRDRLGGAFSSLRASMGVPGDYYGETMTLGRGNILTDTVVLTVQAPADPPQGVRYYWRARVYDRYENGSWSASETGRQYATPDNFEFRFPQYSGRWTSTFTYMPGILMQNLYTAPQPVWASRPVNTDVVFGADGSADIFALRAESMLFPGEAYQTTASLSAASVSELRAAGTLYPKSITDRYLQLPPDITDRTRQLARQIAAGRDNPYDIAQAVTTYLRQNIAYAETVPAPPADQEPIDWFLFDLQLGFCNYYASSEVVMLRSLGIPARISVGYAQGTLYKTGQTELQQELGIGAGVAVYSVQQRDAHTWPEVYFPRYGWVEFEPTVSQQPIERPIEVVVGAADGGAASPAGAEDPSDLRGSDQRLPEDESLGADGASASGGGAVAVGGSIAAAVLLLIAALRFRFRRLIPPLPVLVEASLRRIGVQPPDFLRRWTRRASFSAVERAYQELNGALSLLGAPPEPGDTPAERAEVLRRLLPDAADHVLRLVAEYHTAAYSPRRPNSLIARKAGAAIRWLSWREYARQLLDASRRL